MDSHEQTSTCWLGLASVGLSWVGLGLRFLERPLVLGEILQENVLQHLVVLGQVRAVPVARVDRRKELHFDNSVGVLVNAPRCFPPNLVCSRDDNRNDRHLRLHCHVHCPLFEWDLQPAVARPGALREHAHPAHIARTNNLPNRTRKKTAIRPLPTISGDVAPRDAGVSISLCVRYLGCSVHCLDSPLGVLPVDENAAGHPSQPTYGLHK
mmetsp:Transcript_6711/g.17068  ORF Transcript_6711/g.17068 Transcript_6711/m.17068 type:complete len:210 (-) Transcript_6711:727-1356(-)